MNKKYWVGLTCGSFDLLHAGHILMLEDAKSICFRLMVGLQSDPSIDRPGKNKPIQSLEERRIVLSSIKFVDEIFIYHTEADLYQKLLLEHPDVRILGSDWIGKKFTGDDIFFHDSNMNLKQTEIYYHKREHNYSSSNLRKRVYEAERIKHA